ncbi:MAG: hypothetical protein KDK45_00065 [Leptospiraceae bacterium]|nr:hypothetical protein [Leptospiraceae bacterium]
MNTLELKSDIIQLVEKLEDEAVLHAIRILLLKQNQITSEPEESDFWDELPDSIKEDIEIGIAELDKGEGIPHEEVMKEVKQRYCLA